MENNYAKLSTPSNVLHSTDKASSSALNSDDISIQRSFSCGICFELYTKESRYPISLNCGHTFCLICIKKLGRKKVCIMCSICRKHTFSNYKRLGKNILLLDILEKNNLLEKEETKEKSTTKKIDDEIDSLANVREHNDDAELDEDDAASVVTAFSFGLNYEFGNSFWISNVELEDFYDILENIQDILYGLVGSNGNAQPLNDHHRQLGELRTEMRGVENNLRRSRRTFSDISQRARQLLNAIRNSANSGAVPSVLNNTRSTNARSNIASTYRAFGDTLLGHSFYDNDDIFHHIPLFSFTGEEVHWEDSEWNDQSLERNFMRRESENTRIHCYLCNARFNSNTYIVNQHVRGRRHRELIAANQDQDQVLENEIIMFDNVSNESLIPFNHNYPVVSFSTSARSRASLPYFLPGTFTRENNNNENSEPFEPGVLNINNVSNTTSQNLNNQTNVVRSTPLNDVNHEINNQEIAGRPCTSAYQHRRENLELWNLNEDECWNFGDNSMNYEREIWVDNSISGQNSSSSNYRNNRNFYNYPRDYHNNRNENILPFISIPPIGSGLNSRHSNNGNLIDTRRFRRDYFSNYNRYNFNYVRGRRNNNNNNHRQTFTGRTSNRNENNERNTIIYDSVWQ